MFKGHSVGRVAKEKGTSLIWKTAARWAWWHTLGLVAHTFSPSTHEAEVGRSLCVPGLSAYTVSFRTAKAMI